MRYAQTASVAYTDSVGTIGTRLTGAPAGCAGCAACAVAGTGAAVRADTGIVEAGEVCGGTAVCIGAAGVPAGVATEAAGCTGAGELAAA